MFVFQTVLLLEEICLVLFLAETRLRTEPAIPPLALKRLLMRKATNLWTETCTPSKMNANREAFVVLV